MTLSVYSLKALFYFSLFSLLSISLFAQTNPLHRTCASVEVDKQIREKYQLGDIQDFENWIAPKIAEYQQLAKSGMQQKATYNIPVIVHVIHNGEVVGSGTNISNAQIISQIDVLNEDFNKQNPDVTGIPSAFQNLAADCQINFCLAKKDPSGNILSEPGINRVNRSSKGYSTPPFSTTYIDQTIKPSTSWDPDSYLNIWVMQLEGGLLGYAQFPIQSGLSGLNYPPGAANTDGVVLGYNYFGRTGNVTAPFNLGRTATHEVGHWLGLRHIWGDASCGDDYCSDTPTQQDPNFSCPNYPSASCGNSGDMHMNYMDYVNDGCMFMFTNDQKARMVTVMQNSPRRKLLNSSDACNGVVQTDDAGISAIVFPSSAVCGSSITPTVTIKNFGTTTLTQATIKYQINSGTIATFNWTGNLAFNATEDVTLNSIAISSGTNTIKAYTTNPNNTADVNASNDQTTFTFSAMSNGLPLPLNEGFESPTFPPTGWDVVNFDSDVTWIRSLDAASSGNGSALMAFYDYPGSNGEQDHLYSPFFDLTTKNSPRLTFDVAYTLYTDPTSTMTFSDTLEILISTDCGNSYTSIYKKYGSNLVTSSGPYLESKFIPTVNEWRNEQIDLSAYGSESNAFLIFIGTSDYENQLYIDNINIDGPVGTNNSIASQLKVNVFPNPSKGILNIHANENINTLAIRNITGQIVYEGKINASKTMVDLQTIAKGIYFVDILVGEERMIQRIVLSE